MRKIGVWCNSKGIAMEGGGQKPSGGPLESFRASVDSAREKIATSTAKSIGGCKESLKTHNPKLALKLEETENAVKKVSSEFDELGFWTNYKNYNVELFRPFKRADASKPLLSEIKGSLSLKPENPKMAFVLWNVLAFWLGVIGAVLMFLVSDALVLASLAYAASRMFVGYCFAYLFYFIFICTDKKKWMLFGFVAILLYVLLTVYGAYNSAAHITEGDAVLELVLNILYSAFNIIVCYHAYHLYKGVPSQAEML
ncbi:hypothetical protein AB1Y20_012916 [Prymnesium parvum]|uniref:Uncharacterized protein n=1 Tax=Prymnesium parvum TaxID=97485 RepID=A0AB34IMQ0_PRYPA